MEFIEGQIYKGNITISGGDNGPTKRWIIISPFNKTHIHSIDDPLDLHCWPLTAAMKGLEGGYLKLIETDSQHPVLQLQRDKEKSGIDDIHMGLHGGRLRQMLDLLENAVENSIAYAPFAAGEILAFMDRAYHSKEEVADVKEQVSGHLQALGYGPVS
jgi:hypothetical protein